MPCLNEQDTLLDACRSLGFASSQEPPERCFLVLVDNGSTDRTPELCRALQFELLDSVVAVREPVRGHVPARRRGNETAAHVARTRGRPEATLLIIQADADTHYSPDYVDNVRETISNTPVSGPIGQAITTPPPELSSQYPGVLSEVDLVDDSVQRRFVGSPRFDALVDDKACAYVLGDYQRWGGHRREYFQDGTEILAETTRLAIAGLAQGAERIEIAGASATHSQRRLLADAVQELASAGFPYGDRRIFPRQATMTLSDLEQMVTAGDRRLLDKILAARAAHLVALTALLPAHLARSLTGQVPADPGLRTLMHELPQRSIHEAAKTPGRLLADVLIVAMTARPLLDHRSGFEP
jgi:Glycosyl transferase family 2